MTDAVSTAPTPRTVVSEGLALAAFETPSNGPPILFVHGFPDTHVMWDRVVDRLSSRFRCLAYDVRGAGASQAPLGREAYRLTHLVTDLVAVLDTLSPAEPVHLVGHDWGSVQVWDAVVRASSDPRLTGRIASFTSISGPCLHHIGALSRAARRGGWDRKREVLRQLAHSWYVYAFHVPRVPEFVLRRLNQRLLAARDPATHHFAATLPDDAVNGLNLYRANVFHREPVPGGARTSLPVQLIVPTRDKYVTPALTRDLHRFAPDLTRVEIDAGHWVAWSRPDEVASHVAEFVAAHSSPFAPS
jgi:pimeloyl-ACP methyl ester carboxylesterase